MKYMTAKEAAEKWNISQRRVAVLCTEKRIANAEMLGNMWLIPKNAEKPQDARSLRYFDDKKIKPFLKWAGGKSQILETIKQNFPAGFGKTIRKYAEPFVGGGAVLFEILANYDLDEIMIADINRELVNSFVVVRDNVDELIDLLGYMQDEFLPLSTEGRKEYYYNKRELFNKLKQDESNSMSVALAALFIFLNKTCFNGLYRVNSKGGFNVPMGAYKNPLICDIENLQLISQKLQKVKIVCGDYRESSEFIDENTFVYFDPPYRPLTTTSSFTSYNEVVFTDCNQEELAEYINLLNERQAKILLSNSDPKNYDEEDNFFDNLYANYNIKRIEATRMINSKSTGRGKIKELLISNF
ncbi:MAG: Dam family site-specific DNA-(adenine-N6)-methyltransferase [Phascolarctobacterium sp.]|nr:Dam family site-specific DNA-(adenine-N6)-methyltransferase [Phascolarctobacterium sp.]